MSECAQVGGIEHVHDRREHDYQRLPGFIGIEGPQRLSTQLPPRILSKPEQRMGIGHECFDRRLALCARRSAARSSWSAAHVLASSRSPTISSVPLRRGGRGCCPVRSLDSSCSNRSFPRGGSCSAVGRDEVTPLGRLIWRLSSETQ